MMREQAEVVSNGIVEETSIAAVRSLNNLNSSYRESDGLKEDGRQKDLEARKGLSVLEERMRQLRGPGRESDESPVREINLRSNSRTARKHDVADGRSSA
jgi:hypothetical protein